MDYKDTLLLPVTDFAMRGNLPQNEPARYAKWDKDRVYDKMKKTRQNASVSFNIHDGPPYANGHLHIGHALNKILKDIIVKTHYFFGESVRFTPGWDCHGLPIEQQVEIKLGDKKKGLIWLFTAGCFFVGVFMDFFKLLNGELKDAKGAFVKKR